MTNRMLLQFGKNSITALGLSAVYTIFEQSILNTSLSTVSVEETHSTAKSITNRLTNLGVSKHVNVRIIPSHGPIAAATSSPILGSATVALNPHKVSLIARELKKKHAKSEVIDAILAHEAVHIKENHKFYITSLSSLLYLSFFDLGTYMKFPLPVKILGSFGFLKLAYAQLSQRAEYRADAEAARQGEHRCKALKAVLQEFKPSHAKFSIFKNHPPLQLRIKQLEDIEQEYKPAKSLAS